MSRPPLRRVPASCLGQDDWEGPVWRRWIRFLAEHFRVVRFDERGCGKTERNIGDLSYDRWVEDLEAVADTAAPAAPMILLGVSQGRRVCIDYAVRHPARVSHLVLCGGYARGLARREDPKGERVYTAIIERARLGWGTDDFARDRGWAAGGARPHRGEGLSFMGVPQTGDTSEARQRSVSPPEWPTIAAPWPVHSTTSSRRETPTPTSCSGSSSSSSPAGG